MMLHFCTALVQLTVMASGTDTGESYAAAHQKMIDTGKPLVVMVSTEWCGPCQTMKKTVLPKVRRHGLFRKVSFAMVDADREQKLARQITKGGPVPQLVIYRKTRKGWFRRKLVGSQSVEAVEKFIKEELAECRAERKNKSDDQAEESVAAPKKAQTNAALKVNRG
ncbi:MAG: thioredoxin family protein [Pirellulales bacterium]|nr:thioredoxin family protein [Pirellulales bacterium]